MMVIATPVVFPTDDNTTIASQGPLAYQNMPKKEWNGKSIY